MRQNEKSAELQKEFESMDEFERRASNALAESEEVTKSANRRLRKQGMRDLFFNLPKE